MTCGSTARCAGRPPPSPPSPPSPRTLGADGPFDIAFGSCRVAVPREAPFTESKDEDGRGYEVDALWVLAQEVARGDRRRPDALFLVGDQVYVDEGSPEARAKIEARRGASEPRGEVADFEEYTWLYRLLDGPYFDNQVATLHLDGRRANVRLEKTVPGDRDEHSLKESFRRQLT